MLGISLKTLNFTWPLESIPYLLLEYTNIHGNDVGVINVYCFGDGWLAVTYSFISWSSIVEVFLLCCHFIVPCTSKGDISASAICHLWRLPLAIALISICCIMFAVNDSEIVVCGHEHTLLMHLFSFRLMWMYL